MTRGFASSILISAENLELVEIYWQIKRVIFSWHQNLDSPKVPKYSITFVSALTATTAFMSSTKVAVKGFPFLRSISANEYRFCSLRLTSDSTKCQEVFFNMKYFRFSNSDSPITTNLMSSFKVSIWCFLLQFENLIRKSLKLFPFVES